MKWRTQGSRPRAQCGSDFKKKVFQIIFSGDFQQKTSSKIFFQTISKKKKKRTKRSSQGFWRFPTKILTLQKIELSSAEDMAIFEDLILLGQGLDLRGQGLKDVSLRTSSRPKTSLNTPSLILIIVTIINSTPGNKYTIIATTTLLHKYKTKWIQQQ